MNLLLQPWYLLLAVLCEWVRQEQEKVIAFQKAEIEILMEKLGNRRLLLNDDQRRRLAVKGKALGRKTLQEVAVIAQADTILRWHRTLVVQNRYSGPRGRRQGRPPTDQAIVALTLQMARENVTWGYKRIQGALANVGFRISSSTVANLLKAHGIEPAPQRKRCLSWSTFLRAHWACWEGLEWITPYQSDWRDWRSAVDWVWNSVFSLRLAAPRRPSPRADIRALGGIVLAPPRTSYGESRTSWLSTRRFHPSVRPPPPSRSRIRQIMNPCSRLAA